jgi:hypothetical protein
VFINPKPKIRKKYFQNSKILIKKSKIFIDKNFFCGKLIIKEKKQQIFRIKGRDSQSGGCIPGGIIEGSQNLVFTL